MGVCKIMDTNREIKKYLEMSWSYTVEQEDGYYIVYVNELPGVCTDAETIEEAMRNVKEAITATIELYLKQGKEIPVPVDRAKYKGNIAYRTSPKRHYLIAKLAQRKNKSLSKALDMIVDVGFEHLDS